MKALFLIFLIPLLVSCGSSNQFAKRRYTKGIYIEKRTHVNTKKNNGHKSNSKVVPIHQNYATSLEEKKRVETQEQNDYVLINQHDEFDEEVKTKYHSNIQKDREQQLSEFEDQQSVSDSFENEVEKIKEKRTQVKIAAIVLHILAGIAIAAGIILMILLATEIGLIVFFSGIILLIVGLILFGKSNYLRKQLFLGKTKETIKRKDQKSKKKAIIFASFGLGSAILEIGIAMIDIFIFSASFLTLFLGSYMLTAALVMSLLAVSFAFKPEFNKVAKGWKTFAIISLIVAIAMIVLAVLIIIGFI